MKGVFHNTMRTNTMTPMWLEQGKIDDWLSKQVKSAKKTMKQARALEKKAEKEVKSAAVAAPGEASCSRHNGPWRQTKQEGEVPTRKNKESGTTNRGNRERGR
jgi:hypothetical protein